MTVDEAIAVIIRALPYPTQIHDWDTKGEEEAIRFSWREARYRLSLSSVLSVEEEDGSFLRGSDRAILVGALIRRAVLDGGGDATRV